MKNYEKPVVMVNEGLAEGVYAASGVRIACTSDHWDAWIESVPGGGDHETIYEVHINSNYTFNEDDGFYTVTTVITFSGDVRTVYSSEDTVSSDGTIVTLTHSKKCRDDNSTTNLSVPKGVVPVSISISCSH